MYLAPKGYSVVIDGWGIETREDTARCNHCQRIIFVKTRQDPNEFFCRQCMEPVCPQCANQPCDHWEKKLDREEVTDRWLNEKFNEKLEAAKTMADVHAINAAIARERFLRGLM